MSEDSIKETPVEELNREDLSGELEPKAPKAPEENPLDKIAYFVIFPQNTKVLDEAIEIIPNEVAKKAVLDAINSILVPVTKEQLEEAQKEQADTAKSPVE